MRSEWCGCGEVAREVEAGGLVVWCVGNVEGVCPHRPTDTNVSKLLSLSSR